MKKVNSLFPHLLYLSQMLLVVFFINFVGCASIPQSLIEKNMVWDNVFRAEYPKCRIDKSIDKITVIGTGFAKNKIRKILEEFLTSQNIKIIEPGNLQSVLGGKIIEYGTGLSPVDAQKISQMLQLNHILYFETNFSDSLYGGKVNASLVVRITNIITGELIYNNYVTYVVFRPNPRNYGFAGYAPINESYFELNFLGGLIEQESFKFRYAFGVFRTGIVFKDADYPVIHIVIRDSPAEEAGIISGDSLYKIDGISASTKNELKNYMETKKQGDLLTIEIKRNEQIKIFEMKIPKIKECEDYIKEKPKENKINI